ncbi:MAG: hypothetical protein A2289_19775 [Deltaproteobacteria bacterium RIFOXYA12_FULL_58_15]|nr:MAG: hypothetical protein A2289_19775 [Deltaproteobacteria bacterium RIFOXYA12_FULL_58_15]
MSIATSPSWSRPWRRWFVTPARPVERIEVKARDGLNLVVRRIRHPGSGPAVLLLHGLAANHHSFNFPGRSLAEWLAARGFDCYLPNLRGHGDSERRAFDWDLDDYLEADLPAIVDAVLKTSGQEQLHWVGHSMGGMLLFCYGILNSKAPIASGVTMGSTLDYDQESNAFATLASLRPLLDYLPVVPYGTVTHLLAPLLGRIADPLTAFNFAHGNIEPEMARRAYALGFHTIPMSLLRNLASVFEPGGLRKRDGTVHFVEQAGKYTIPTLLQAASLDSQAPVASVEKTASMLGGTVETAVFGRLQNCETDYKHWDLLIGRSAPDEVWPRIAAWLEAHPL